MDSLNVDGVTSVGRWGSSVAANSGAAGTVFALVMDSAFSGGWSATGVCDETDGSARSSFGEGTLSGSATGGFDLPTGIGSSSSGEVAGSALLGEPFVSSRDDCRNLLHVSSKIGNVRYTSKLMTRITSWRMVLGLGSPVPMVTMREKTERMSMNVAPNPRLNLTRTEPLESDLLL